MKCNNWIGPAIAVAIALTAQASVAQDRRFADGRYVGPGDGGDIEITVSNGIASALVVSQGCIGQIDGRTVRVSDDLWEIVAIDADGCVLSLQRDGSRSFEVRESRECIIYHGASCGFFGYVSKAGQ